MSNTWLRRALVSAAALGIALLGGSFGGTAQAAPPPDEDVIMQPQIIGGHNATETYPWHAQMSNGCGGSLVAPQWIVTANHCGSATSARIGNVNRGSGGEVRSIDRRITKPGTDLTVMHLTTASTQAVIPMASTHPATGSAVRLIGFGCTSWPSCSNPSYLQEIDLTVLAASRCNGTSIDLCVSGDRTHSACHGDSGGPAVVGSRGNWTLVGETYRAGDSGPECGTTTLYTGIAGNLTWIKQQVGDTTPPGGKKFENLNNVNIPDNGAAVTSDVTVTGISGNAPSTLKVNVDIKHTYRGDVVIDLGAPDGTAYRLKASNNDSADNVITTYTVNASSEVANGTWKLKVQDVYSADTGYIDAWSVEF